MMKTNKLILQYEHNKNRIWTFVHENIKCGSMYKDVVLDFATNSIYNQKGFQTSLRCCLSVVELQQTL